MGYELGKTQEEINALPYDEFEFHFARSLLIPISWQKEELKSARTIGAILKVNAKECFNNYLEPIPEDDENLYNQAKEFIKKGK